MKYALLTLLLALTLFNCQNNQPSATTTSAKPTAQEQTKQEQTSVAEEIQKPTAPDRYYVSAPSGLNYRAKPQGEILGKFPLNTELAITKRTGIVQDLKDGNLIIVGEWVGVAKNKQTVYVFDGFLSREKTRKVKQQSTKVYQLNEYQKGKNRIGFIVLTDGFVMSNHPDSVVISDEYLGYKEVKEYHQLNKKHRKNFLKNAHIKETDKIFIYNYQLDEIKTLAVRNFPLMAYINPYGASQPIEQYDWLVGFDLGAKSPFLDYLYYYNSFVAIAPENPFQTGKIQPIIWKEIDQKQLPDVRISDANASIRESYEGKAAYKFSLDNLDYFLQVYLRDREESGGNGFHLIVQATNKQIVFNEMGYDSEGASLNALTYADKKSDDLPAQWTGKLFKNKPAVMFGFYSHSFGCASIDVLDMTEANFTILCDNRH